MPLFEFKCRKCDYCFEDLASSDASVCCPHCGSKDTEKLMSACVRTRSGKAGNDYSGTYSGGGGCGGCSGGNCASCGR